MLFTIFTIGLTCHFGPLLFLLCSCLSSKCFPCSIRSPLLRSFCADGTNPCPFSAQVGTARGKWHEKGGEQTPLPGPIIEKDNL